MSDFPVSLSLFFGIFCPYVGASLLRVKGKGVWSMAIRFFSLLIFSQLLLSSLVIMYSTSLQAQLIYDQHQSPFLWRDYQSSVKALLSDSVYFVSQGNFKSLTLCSTLSLPSRSLLEVVLFFLLKWLQNIITSVNAPNITEEEYNYDTFRNILTVVCGVKTDDRWSASALLVYKIPPLEICFLAKFHLRW